MMEVSSYLEYLCRICAANTKGKNSVAECVYIFKNPDLKQKIEKHLLLKVCEYDALPKILCKACYRKVEDIAALTNIAKHTHEVFNDYLINKSTKTLASDTGRQYESNKQDANNISDKNIEKLHINSFRFPSTAPPPMVFLPGLSLSSIKKAPTPLLAETKNNIALGSTHHEDLQKNNNTHRKQNLTLDTKYTPKSIAQKSLNLTIPQQKKDAMNTASHSNRKHNSPPGVINFFPTITKQPLVNTLAGGNYLMSRLNSVAEKDAYRKLKSPSQPKDLNCPANTTNSKRKSASRSTNNDKGASHVISLLKVCSQKQKVSVPYATSIAENLSDKLVTNSNPLICSSPENNTLSAGGAPSKTEFSEEILLGKVIKDIDLLKLILKALKWTVNKETLESQIQRLRNSKFTDIMSDPNLLQDTDLTQLLGPYLAPVLQAAYAFQQQQQLLNILQAEKSAKITREAKPIELTTNDIHRTIPYKLPPETSVQLVPALPEENDINRAQPSNSNSSIPKFSFTNSKSTNSNDLNLNSNQSIKATITKSQTSHIYTNVEEHEMHQSPSKTNQNTDYTQQSKSRHKHSRNNSEIPSVEALMAFARKQKNSTLRRLNKRGNAKIISLNTAPSNQCETPINIDDDDDIILVEQTGDNKTSSNKANKRNIEKTLTRSQSIDCIDSTPQLANSFSETAASKSVAATATSAETDKATATLASTAETGDVYSRPISKRRKTVIHTTMREKSIICENTLHKGQQIQQSEEVPLVDETKTAQVPSVPVTVSSRLSEQSPSNGEANNVNLISPDQVANPGCIAMNAEADLKEANIGKPRKQSNSRMALGQHLLEAIGLQKGPDKNETSRDTEVSSSNNGKGSVQQIRCVLKRSLKQAQENQHSKLEFASISADNEIRSPEEPTEIDPGESNEIPSTNKNMEDNQGENITSNSKQEDNDFCKSSIIRSPQKRLSASTDKARNKFANAEENNENEMGKTYNTESTENTSEVLAVGETNTSSLNATEATTQQKLPGRRRGRKRNADKIAEALSANSKNKYQKVDQTILDESLRRPTRHSKAMSKYYKGPGKSECTLRSLPSRTTRNKKHS